MAKKLNLGEKTVSGRLVQDPETVHTRKGQAMTMLRVVPRESGTPRSASQLGNLGQASVLVSHDRIPYSEVESLRENDFVTVRGQSVIGTVKTQDGQLEGRHRMVAQELWPQPPVERDKTVTETVEHSKRPIPWQVDGFDEHWEPELCIPRGALEDDPELADELIDLDAERFPNRDRHDVVRRGVDGKTAYTRSDIRALEELSRDNASAAGAKYKALTARRRTHACTAVSDALDNLPGGPRSAVPPGYQNTWDFTRDYIADPDEDHAVVQSRLGYEMAEQLGPDVVAGWVDEAHEKLSELDTRNRQEQVLDDGADRSLQDYLSDYPRNINEPSRDAERYIAQQQVMKGPVLPGADPDWRPF